MYSTPFFSLDICLKNDNYDNCDNCDNDGACGNDDSTCWLITILMIDDKALVALGIYLLKFCLREREKNTKRKEMHDKIAVFSAISYRKMKITEKNINK